MPTLARGANSTGLQLSCPSLSEVAAGESPIMGQSDREYSEVLSHRPHTLLVRLPFLPPTNEASSGNHWSARSRNGRLIRQAFAVIVPDSKRPPVPLDHAAVTCIRYSASKPDYDGLVRSFKHVIDCLLSRTRGRRQIVIDDNMSVIGIPKYQWVKTASSKGYVEIIVEDRAPWIVTYR